MWPPSAVYQHRAATVGGPLRVNERVHGAGGSRPRGHRRLRTAPVQYTSMRAHERWRQRVGARGPPPAQGEPGRRHSGDYVATVQRIHPRRPAWQRGHAMSGCPCNHFDLRAEYIQSWLEKKWVKRGAPGPVQIREMSELFRLGHAQAGQASRRDCLANRLVHRHGRDERGVRHPLLGLVGHARKAHAGHVAAVKVGPLLPRGGVQPRGPSPPPGPPGSFTAPPRRRPPCGQRGGRRGRPTQTRGCAGH